MRGCILTSPHSSWPEGYFESAIKHARLRCMNVSSLSQRALIDPFHLDFRACAMDWRVKSAGSRREHVGRVAGRAHSCISKVLVVVKTSHFTADPFHLDFRACAMDWRVKSAGSRGEHVGWVAGPALAFHGDKMGAKVHCRIIHCTTGRIKARNPAERLSFSFSKKAKYRIPQR